MIPDGWNSKREARNYQHYLGATYKKEISPGGLNSQGSQYIPGPVQSVRKKKMIVD